MGGDGAGGFGLRTSIAAVVGGTASEIGGGKFSNGAVSAAFVHMFNREAGYYAMKRAMGTTQEGLEAKADASRNVATASGFLSALTSLIPNSISQGLSKIFGVTSIAATYNAHALDAERGAYQQEGMIVDTLTTFTDYCKNPVIEFIYDTSFTTAAPYVFDYGKPE